MDTEGPFAPEPVEGRRAGPDPQFLAAIVKTKLALVDRTVLLRYVEEHRRAQREHRKESEMGQLVFGTVLGVGILILLGVDALALPAATGLVTRLLTFLPNLLVALLLLGTGWIVAHFLAQAALLGAVNAQLAGAPLLASAVRWLVLVFAGAAGLRSRAARAPG
jgi:Conserved TM helix